MFAPRFAATDDPTPDDYNAKHGMSNSFAPGCTYCGSISGEDFIAYVRSGGVVGGSDKNYKVYLERATGTPAVTEERVETTPQGAYSAPSASRQAPERCARSSTSSTSPLSSATSSSRRGTRATSRTPCT
jgi:hypothetical protein